MKPARITELAEFYREALFGDTLPFWLEHGVDRPHGGFQTHLTREGRVWCTDKSVWFAGRATWLFATLHARYPQRGPWLDLALHGERFLAAHCFDDDGRMFFLLDRDGQPLRKRRYRYSEVFAALAYGALAEATGKTQFADRAADIFATLVDAMTTPAVSDPKVNPQVRPMIGLSPVMCLLSVTEALLPVLGAERCAPVIASATRDVLELFVRPEDQSVREAVGPDGGLIDA
ncbi:MAG TPA: AGE family epimerase/isomerase, partial [Phycisphaerae bacterium]|nr:AGE family epimerase/isomerase [Phycisphaerae bacterium]